MSTYRGRGAIIDLFISYLCLIFKQMHFDDAYGAYFDFGNHTEKVCCLHVSVPLTMIPFLLCTFHKH